MKKLFISIAIVSVFAIAAFAQGGKIGVREWKLIQVNGVNVPDSSAAYVELNSDQTRFTGNAGCNRMFGAISVQGSQVDFSNIGTTKMACADPGKQKVETDFVRALKDADSFKQKGNSLELYVRRRVVARFIAPTKQSPVDPAAVELEEKKWMLESINGVPISENGRAAFLVFDKADESAGGNSSCNVFGGSYSSAGTTLKITEVIATMRACVEDDRMKIEREFLDGLEKTNRYEIKGDKLMLFEDKRLLLTLIGQAK